MIGFTSRWGRRTSSGRRIGGMRQIRSSTSRSGTPGQSRISSAKIRGSIGGCIGGGRRGQRGKRRSSMIENFAADDAGACHGTCLSQSEAQQGSILWQNDVPCEAAADIAFGGGDQAGAKSGVVHHPHDRVRQLLRLERWN